MWKRLRQWFSRLGRATQHSSVRYQFQIPDPDRPIPPEERRLGPSGVLIPFQPASPDLGVLRDRPIDEISTGIGTYGMGGPGFLGFRLGSEWLVIAIWGADTWTLVDDLLVRDIHHEQYGRPQPWITAGGNHLGPHLVGATINAFTLEPHHLEIRFSQGSILTIDPDPHRRAVHEGSKEPRAFLETDDLRRAVFLSPTTEIWV